MGKPVAGEVLVVPFPQTDLKVGKPRPAQITSQSRSGGFSIPLGPSDFSRGRLPIASYIRPNRLFTVEQSVILRRVGQITDNKLQSVLAAVRQIFS